MSNMNYVAIFLLQFFFFLLQFFFFTLPAVLFQKILIFSLNVFKSQKIAQLNNHHHQQLCPITKGTKRLTSHSTIAHCFEKPISRAYISTVQVKRSRHFQEVPNENVRLDPNLTTSVTSTTLSGGGFREKTERATSLTFSVGTLKLK